MAAECCSRGPHRLEKVNKEATNCWVYYSNSVMCLMAAFRTQKQTRDHRKGWKMKEFIGK